MTTSVKLGLIVFAAGYAISSFSIDEKTAGMAAELFTRAMSYAVAIGAASLAPALAANRFSWPVRFLTGAAAGAAASMCAYGALRAQLGSYVSMPVIPTKVEISDAEASLLVGGAMGFVNSVVPSFFSSLIPEAPKTGFLYGIGAGLSYPFIMSICSRFNRA